MSAPIALSLRQRALRAAAVFLGSGLLLALLLLTPGEAGADVPAPPAGAPSSAASPAPKKAGKGDKAPSKPRRVKRLLPQEDFGDY